MFLKKLFYASASILMLAAAYHLGASESRAQSTGTIAGFETVPGIFYVLTSNGDVYNNVYPFSGAPTRLGNFWSGHEPTAAAMQSFGALKAKYR